MFDNRFGRTNNDTVFATAIAFFRNNIVGNQVATYECRAAFLMDMGFILFFKIADQFGKRRPGIRVRKYMSELLWRTERIKSFFTGRPPLLTKHSAASIHRVYRFSSAKLTAAIPFVFTPIDSCIAKNCERYEKDLKENT